MVDIHGIARCLAYEMSILDENRSAGSIMLVLSNCHMFFCLFNLCLLLSESNNCSHLLSTTSVWAFCYLFCLLVICCSCSSSVNTGITLSISHIGN